MPDTWGNTRTFGCFHKGDSGGSGSYGCGWVDGVQRGLSRELLPAAGDCRFGACPLGKHQLLSTQGQLTSAKASEGQP